MPPGRSYAHEETGDGVTTGLRLVNDIRELHTETPIVLLSNVNVTTVLEDAQDYVHGIDNTIFVRKSSTPPDRFADLAERVLTEGIKSLHKWRWFSKVVSAFILQPNIWGIGFDLTKLLKNTQRR